MGSEGRPLVDLGQRRRGLFKSRVLRAMRAIRVGFYCEVAEARLYKWLKVLRLNHSGRIGKASGMRKVVLSL